MTLKRDLSEDTLAVKVTPEKIIKIGEVNSSSESTLEIQWEDGKLAEDEAEEISKSLSQSSIKTEDPNDEVIVPLKTAERLTTDSIGQQQKSAETSLTSVELTVNKNEQITNQNNANSIPKSFSENLINSEDFSKFEKEASEKSKDERLLKLIDEAHRLNEVLIPQLQHRKGVLVQALANVDKQINEAQTKLSDVLNQIKQLK